MTIQNIMRSLRRSGYSVRKEYWYGSPVLIVEHVFSYNALNTFADVQERAEKHGFTVEERGSKSVIYPADYAETRDSFKNSDANLWQAEHDRIMKEKAETT